MWSPDLNPPESGLPDDIFDFTILAQISIGKVAQTGGEVFNLHVCSPSSLVSIESGKFISQTLVLEKYDYIVIRERIDKLLKHTHSCDNWDSVIKTLCLCIWYADQW